MTPHASAVAPEGTGGDGSRGSAVEAAARSKPRKRKKSRLPPPSSVEAAAQSKGTKRKKKVASSSAAAGPAIPSFPSVGDDGNGTGTGDGQQQQQLAAGDGRGKQRVVWTEELHDMFLKAYNILGEDAVPKKILALMNVDGITRENVASHLQKYRLSLKQEEKRVPDQGDQRPTLDAEASSSQTPSPTTPSPHPPPAQAQEPAPLSSLLQPLPPRPQQAPFAALDVSQVQIGHGQQLLQTPPDCFDINTTAADLLLGPGIPMAQPIQQRLFTPPPPEATTVATRRKLFKKPQEAGRDNAAASGYSPVLVERSVPDANMRYEEAEMHMAQLGMMAAEAEDGQGQDAADGMAAKAEDGQGAPAEPEAAEMAAAGHEEGQGRAGEPGEAPAGSSSPPGSSIHGKYWKIDDDEVSWDFGFLWYPTAAVARNKP